MKQATLSIFLALTLIGCDTGGEWSAKELKEWYVKLDKSDSWPLSPLYYQGSDKEYHYFICRSMDTWVPVWVRKEEIEIEDLKPYATTSQSSNFPGHYKVDPANDFCKVVENNNQDNQSAYSTRGGGASTREQLQRQMSKISTFILFAITLLFFGCGYNGENELWIVPEGYTGWLIVVPDQKEGKEKEYENGWRVYRFPANGILVTQFRFNEGWHESKYFYIDKNGDRIEIPTVVNLKDSERIAEGDSFAFLGASSMSGSKIPYDVILYTNVHKKGSESFEPDVQDYLTLNVSNKSSYSTTGSGASLREQIRRQMSKIGILLSILLFTFGCSSRSDDEIWLIPEGYRGWLIIVPDRPEGIEKKNEGEKLVLEFPDSGIIKTKFGLPTGWHSKYYYFVDSEGERTEILYSHNGSEAEQLADGVPYLFFGTTSWRSPFPYEEFYAIILKEKGKVYGPDYPRPHEVLLEYAKKNNDI